MALRPVVLFACCFHVLYFLFQLQLTKGQLTFVTRSKKDSFRIGDEACKINTTICTSVKASCQENGLCLCDDMYPHFRNPVITRKHTGGDNYKVSYGESYGCVEDELISIFLGHSCDFKSFPVIPNEPEKVTTFVDDADAAEKVDSCTRMKNTYAKYPTNNSLTLITWLDESYIDYDIENGVLNFKWKKSVGKLQGLIIKMEFRCQLKNNGHTDLCFEGKILGTWTNPAGICQTKTTKGKCCVFPFVYGSLTYYECTPIANYGRPWCSLTANYDEDGEWGDCEVAKPSSSTTMSSPTLVITTKPITTVPRRSSDSTTRNPPTKSSESMTDNRLTTNRGTIPTSLSNKSGLNVAAVAVSVGAAAVVSVFIFGVFVWCLVKRRRKQREQFQKTTNGANESAYETVGGASEPGVTNPEYDTPGMIENEYETPETVIKTNKVNGDVYAVSEKQKKPSTNEIESINEGLYAISDTMNFPEKEGKTSDSIGLNYLDAEKIEFSRAREETDGYEPTEYASIDLDQ